MIGYRGWPRVPRDAGLGPADRRVALAVARAMFPPGQRLTGADEGTVDRLEDVGRQFGPVAQRGYAAALRLLEQETRLTHRNRPFSSLSRDEAERHLAGLADGSVRQRALALALTLPLKLAYFDDPEVYRLPPDPVVTTRDLPSMWKAAGAAALALGAAVVASVFGGRR